MKKLKKKVNLKVGQIKKINKILYFTLKKEYNSRKITKTLFAEKLQVSRPTLNKILLNEEEYIKVMNNES